MQLRLLWPRDSSPWRKTTNCRCKSSSTAAVPCFAWTSSRHNSQRSDKVLPTVRYSFPNACSGMNCLKLTRLPSILNRGENHPAEDVMQQLHHQQQRL